MASELIMESAPPEDSPRRPRRKRKSEAPAAPARRSDSEPSEGAAVARPSRAFELVGLATGAAALLLLLCLVSYDAADLASGSAAARSGQTHNWVGPVGAQLADLILTLVGSAGFLLVATLGLVGAMLFFHLPMALRLGEVVAYVLGIAGGAALAQVGFPAARPLGRLPGGLLGELLGEIARSMLGTVGATIALSSILLGAVVAVAPFSVADLLRSGSGLLLTWLRGRLRGAATATAALREAWAQRRDLARDRKLHAAAQRRANLVSDESEDEAPGPVVVVAPTPPAERTKSAAKVPARSKTSPAGVAPAAGRDFEWSLGLPSVVPESSAPDAEEGWSLGDTAAPPAAPPAEPSAGAEGAPRGASAPVVAGVEPLVDPFSPSDPADDLDELFDEVLGEGEAPAAPSARAALPNPAPRRAAPGEGPTIYEHPAASRQMSLHDLDRAPVAPRSAPGSWELPPVSLLDYTAHAAEAVDREALKDRAKRLEDKLANYGVKGQVVEIHPGPVVTMFEFKPGPGIRISKIANLSDDLAMSLEAVRVRIVAPIPGKAVVGIEVPSEKRQTVYLKELIADSSFQDSGMRLPMCLGKNIIGYPVVQDLAKMPHLLVAGATGSGKSVLVNALVVSLMYRYSPEDLRLIMVDPKQLEFALYEGIPHLLLPVVTDPKKAAAALRWAVNEMDRRYTLMREARVRQLKDYNKWVEAQQSALHQEQVSRSIRLDDDDLDDDDAYCELPEPPEKLPNLVVIIDEFAELMMVASKDVEVSVTRLAQKARASGIHLVLATQRPSVDVITGVIKANFPARIGLQVAQREDSRTILGQNGAENLLGDGDMLVMSPGTSGLRRVHGALVTDGEIQRICEHWKKQGRPDYRMEILSDEEKDEKASDGDDIKEDMYDQAVFVVAEARMASASMLQRRLRIGYNRAARLIEIMEREGVVGPPDGARPREVLVPPPVEL